MKKNLPVWVLLVTVVVFGVFAFFGGMKYSSSVSAFDSQNGAARKFGAGGAPNLANRGMLAGAPNGGGLINGDILAKDDKSVTVQMRDGSSKIVFFSDSTRIAKAVDGNVADLVIGKSVNITGTANSDGSISAQMIQLRSPIQEEMMKNSQQILQK